jgi:hypothetical protein
VYGWDRRPAIVPLLDERVTSERIERGNRLAGRPLAGVEPMLPGELVTS